MKKNIYVDNNMDNEKALPAAGGAGIGHAAGTQVYVMFGHSDSIAAPPGEPLPKIPDGCMLVTLAECGDVLQVSMPGKKLAYDNLRDLFNDPAQQAMLADPIANKALIEKTIGMKININYPLAFLPQNRQYVDIEYAAQLAHNNWPYHGYVTYHTSGLYRGGSVIATTTTISASDLKNKWKEMYPEGILYPNRDEVISTMTKLISDNNIKPVFHLIEQLGSTYKIKQSQLFERFPGVYYVMTCRGSSTNEAKATMQLRRTTSREMSVVADYNASPNKIFTGFVDHMYRLPVGKTYADYSFPKKVYAHIVAEPNSTKDRRQVIELKSLGNNDVVGGAGGEGHKPKMMKDKIASRKAELIGQIASIEDAINTTGMNVDELETLLTSLKESSSGSSGSSGSNNAGTSSNNYNYNYNNANQGGGRRRSTKKSRRARRIRRKTYRR